MVHCNDVLAVDSKATCLAISPKCKNLDALSSLRRVNRIRCTLTEGLLEQLAVMPKLRHLQIRLPRSDDIPSFRPLTQITTLVLTCNKHQSGLKFLNGVDNLRSLCISAAMGITRLTPLSQLRNLCELYIDGTISGRGNIQTLAPLAKLPELRFAVLLLRLEKQNRTLKPLHGLSKLAYLHLSDDYTEEEYDRLLAAVPRLKQIRFNGGKRWPADGS